MSEDTSLSTRSILTFGVFASALALAGIGWSLQEQKAVSERSIEFNEGMSIPVPKGSSNIRIWIPIPANDAYQNAQLLSVESPYPYRITQEKDFGNRLIYLEAAFPITSEGGGTSSLKARSPKLTAQDETIEIKAFYRIVRKEQRRLDRVEEKVTEPKATFTLSDYLKSRGLETINEKIVKIAGESTHGVRDPMEKARAIYEYVFKHMRYDKSGTGWGRGDSIYACDIGKGNCTDFHSLFIVLARASHIPARFRMGIPLPEGKEGEPSGSYHCWAEFYIEGKGWIPVDISDAWKNPNRAEYFFGNLDANRILLSAGRDILLSPPQKGAPLNYLSRPYVEINGRPVNDFKLERRFKDKRA